MTRSLEEIEREAALVRKRAETFARVWGGGLSAEEDRLAQEALSSINAELAAMAEKAAPPARNPDPTIRKLSPAEAAERAAAIRADARYWDPSKADADGKRLTAEAHEQLVREHTELVARATEEA